MEVAGTQRLEHCVVCSRARRLAAFVANFIRGVVFIWTRMPLVALLHVVVGGAWFVALIFSAGKIGKSGPDSWIGWADHNLSIGLMRVMRVRSLPAMSPVSEMAKFCRPPIHGLPEWVLPMGNSEKMRFVVYGSTVMLCRVQTPGV